MITIYSEWRHPKTGDWFPVGTKFTQSLLPGNVWYWIKTDGQRGEIELAGIPGDSIKSDVDLDSIDRTEDPS